MKTILTLSGEFYTVDEKLPKEGRKLHILTNWGEFVEAELFLSNFWHGRQYFIKPADTKFWSYDVTIKEDTPVTNGSGLAIHNPDIVINATRQADLPGYLTDDAKWMMYTPYDSISFECEFTPNIHSNPLPYNEERTFRMTVNKPGILGFIYRLFRLKKGIETYSFVGITHLGYPVLVNDETEVSGKIEVVPGTMKKIS
jgi:hypothetical protein